MNRRNQNFRKKKKKTTFNVDYWRKGRNYPFRSLIVSIKALHILEADPHLEKAAEVLKNKLSEAVTQAQYDCKKRNKPDFWIQREADWILEQLDIEMLHIYCRKKLSYNPIPQDCLKNYQNA